VSASQEVLFDVKLRSVPEIDIQQGGERSSK